MLPQNREAGNERSGIGHTSSTGSSRRSPGDEDQPGLKRRGTNNASEARPLKRSSQPPHLIDGTQPPWMGSTVKQTGFTGENPLPVDSATRDLAPGHEVCDNSDNSRLRQMAASPHYSRHRPRRYGNTAAGFQGPAVPADANVDEQSASPLSSSSAASRTTSWDEHHPPALHSSAEWSVQPCSSSGAADNILSVTPDIDRIRHTLDIRTFQQYSGAIPTSGIHPHMTNSIPEPATFVDGQNHGTHNARLGSFNADSQNPPDSQLSVEMQPSFPGAGPSLNGETTTSTNQSKRFQLSPTLRAPRLRGSFAYTSRDVAQQNLTDLSHSPLAPNNSSVSYGFSNSNPHLHSQPIGHATSVHSSINIDPLISQDPRVHSSASVHDFFVSYSDGHPRMPAQLAREEQATRAYTPGLHHPSYPTDISSQTISEDASRPLAYVPGDLGLQGRGDYPRPMQPGPNVVNYSQGALSFEPPRFHEKGDPGPAQPLSSRGSSSLESPETGIDEGEPNSIEPEISYDLDEYDSSSARLQKKARAAFSEDARRETGETRKMGACIRCRFQRSRCKPSLDDPNAECQTCRDVQKESKKVVHRLPCLRWKITDIVLCRADIGHGGSLGLTERWQGFAIRDVTEWSSEAPRTIHITLGICPTPLALQVRKFKPSPGDITFRSWRDGNVEKRVELAPYALVNVRQTALKFHEYLNLNTMKTLEMAIRDTNHDDLVLETLQWAKRQCQNLKVDGLPDCQQPDEWQFLVDALRLWVAIKHTTGSSYVCGTDKLDMNGKVDDQSYPLYGRVSTPRMIVAQNDSIYGGEVIPPLRKRVLKHLDNHLKANKPRNWFTLYLVTFLFLHSASITSADRRRHGRENGALKGYSLPQFVEELQFGANVLLAYWHYYRTDEDPLEVDCLDRHRSRLMDLTAEQFTFIQKSCKKLRETRELFRDMTNWDDPLYWVCRMFDQKWEVSETFMS